MDSLTQTTLQQLHGQLAHARTASERAEAVRTAARQLGRKEQTVYRLLRGMGWSSGRKTRSDKGASAVGVEALTQISKIMAKGRNKRGQPNTPTSEAHRIAGEQGMPAAAVSYSHTTRMLREHGLSMKHLRAQEGAVARVSTHPNHVWFFDISVAMQWYFRDPESGKKLDLYNDAGARTYKPEHFKAINRVIHRYMVVDHLTGAYWVQYRYSSGERADDVVDFLYSAMAAKPGELGQALPLRGIPTHLVMDQGSANKAGIVQSLLGKDGLGVKVEYHAAGNAKASGSVESRHNHWQRSYEGRLSLHPAEDLDSLNRTAAQFCALANAERPHSRHGRSPMQAWITILPSQLREAPDRDTFFQLATSSPRVATLNNYLRLRADKRQWYISGDHVHTGQKVRFRLAPFAPNGIRVWDEHGRELAAEELHFDAFNQALNGPRHAWDDETAKGASVPTTPAQQVVRQVEAGTAEIDIQDVFGNLSERIARQAFLPVTGHAWAPLPTSLTADPVMGSLDAREDVIRRLGRSLTPEEGAWWRERTAAGVTAAELDELYAAFTTDEADHTVATGTY